MAQITVSQAARESGLSDSLIKHAAAKGKIDGAQKFGKTWVFEDGAFWQWHRSRPGRGRPSESK